MIAPLRFESVSSDHFPKPIKAQAMTTTDTFKKGCFAAYYIGDDYVRQWPQWKRLMDAGLISHQDTQKTVRQDKEGMKS